MTTDMPAFVRELPVAVLAVFLTQASEGFVDFPKNGSCFTQNRCGFQ